MDTIFPELPTELSHPADFNLSSDGQESASDQSPRLRGRKRYNLEREMDNLPYYSDYFVDRGLFLPPPNILFFPFFGLLTIALYAQSM